MRRVVIMGPPGSGKSTLARALGERHRLPVFHLDQAYWTANWIEAPSERFSAEVARLAALDAWVIDGNYAATLEPRLRRADTVIYLDASTVVSTVKVLKRLVRSYGRVRPDAAAGCAERMDWSFLRWVWSWNRERRESHLALVESFRGDRFVVRAGSDARKLLAGKPGGGLRA